MNQDHPALEAARASWKAVMAGDKQSWLGLMADDICVEDPIGVAPTNPDGLGIRGKAALADFWEKNIGPNTITIEARDSRTAGMESAHHLTLTMQFSNGVSSIVSGLFTYQVNEAGQLTNLRGYWDMPDMTFKQPDGS